MRGCLHCEKCREVCPKHAIAPAHIEDGILNARTPRMDFKSGWCDFCENEPGGPKCVAACPTHALSCPDPSQAIIGKAEINRDWCLAAKGMGCHECVDVCNYEALELGADNVPVVDVDACNGCGACELALRVHHAAVPPGRAAGHDRRAHSHPDGRDQRCGRAAGVYRARQGVLRLGVPRAFYVAR